MIKRPTSSPALRIGCYWRKDECQVILDVDKPIIEGGKAALAVTALSLILFIVAIVLGIARLFERFGGHIGMGAAAMAFVGAFFITAGWALMLGTWIAWWSKKVRAANACKIWH